MRAQLVPEEGYEAGAVSEVSEPLLGSGEDLWNKK